MPISAHRPAGPRRVVDFAVVGGGIVGLATARALQARFEGAQVVVLEQEIALGTHQTGHNSGVVHAGIYYGPGSLKARLCTDGRLRLKEYAAANGIPYQECGKLVVAVDDSEVEPLSELHRRATANGVPGLRLLAGAAITEVEPHVRAVAALHSPATAVTDFARVARAYADDVVRGGGRILTGFRVTALRQDADTVHVTAASGASLVAGRVVACGGLWSDRLATLAGDEQDPRIVPFRGDYYELAADRRGLVNGLVYPVPDPRYPFLGVHLTRTVTGRVLVGPNAVLAGARAGYRRRALSPVDLADTLRSPGFRRLARTHWRTGVQELVRATSRRAFAAEARRYVPALDARDLVRAQSGVRAQAVAADGTLVDDFRISSTGRVTNVRNAPSPAATSSLAIAEEIVDRVAAG